jgi:hypothetical protein
LALMAGLPCAVDESIPQKTYFWRPGRHGGFWKRVTRRVGPPRAEYLGLGAHVDHTDAISGLQLNPWRPD